VTFPVMLPLGGWSLHPHAVMEVIAYTVGFQIYRWARRREAGASVSIEQQLWVVAGAILGAAAGAKLLAWAESFQVYWALRHEPQAWLGAKTIVGGLLGGWAGAEVAKRWVGVRQSTGDAYVAGLVWGIAVGRMGCFLSGLEDHTYGVATTLPWGVDFGDGITRHPTQLYESVAVIGLGLIVWARSQYSYERGELFRLFLGGYLLFRFAIEFFKPVEHPIVGLSVIQVASLVGATVAISGIVKMRRTNVGRAAAVVSRKGAAL
jgi:phosphatidylglycerol---prolipoprotein diacylglyceryl transferase